jgi:hypothetical protein
VPPAANLAASLPPRPAAPPPLPPQAPAANDDPWLRLDKAEHVIFGAALVIAAYLLLRRCGGLTLAPALAWAVAASVFGGVGKEIGDVLGW